VTFSAHELRAISAALSVAAGVYDDDAANAEAAQQALRAGAGLAPAPCHMADEIRRLAADARELADRIDNPKEAHR
jgi:hypothetical protein